jgi:hypothetical protein
MITLQTYADFQELCDLIYEVQASEGLDDAAAFQAACAEMPALLEMDVDSRYVASRFILFDDAGMPARSI